LHIAIIFVVLKVVGIFPGSSTLLKKAVNTVVERIPQCLKDSLKILSLSADFSVFNLIIAEFISSIVKGAGIAVLFLFVSFLLFF